MGVRVDIRVPQEYPRYCTTLLEALFADHADVSVTKHFTEGQSGTYVILVDATRQDGRKELPVVVKIGPDHLIKQEWHATKDYIDGQLPGFVPISQTLASVPVSEEDGSTVSYSAARYELAGNGVFEIETLRKYALTASSAELWSVLEKRLFQQLNRIWHTPAAPILRRVNATYDRILPVNLLLDFIGVETAPDSLLDATHDPAQYPTCQPGDVVQLLNFVITEIDREDHALTVDLPNPEGLRPSAYRLRIRSVAHIDQYHLQERVSSLTGRVQKTRHLLLQEAIRAALPPALDLAQPLLHLPESNEPLPNPLVRWQALLHEEMRMRIGTVHGDLNTGNVLIDVDAGTTFLIDCAHAHRDHALYDLVRLESEVLLHLVAERVFSLGLEPTAIYDLYSWLDYVTRREPNPPGSFSLPQPLLQKMSQLQSAFIALTTIRNCARQYLAEGEQWREYYIALSLTLLGSLKFASLDRATAGMNPKAIAFWGAATLLARLEQPAQLLQIRWEKIAVKEADSVRTHTADSTQPNVFINYAMKGDTITGDTKNETNIYGHVTGPIHTGSGNIYEGQTKSSEERDARGGEVSQQQYKDRRLDAAMPSRCCFNQRTEVRVLIALSNSEGLRRFLPDNTEKGKLISKLRSFLPDNTEKGKLISKQDVGASLSTIEFPIDPNTGQIRNTTLYLRLVAPDFKIDKDLVEIQILPNQDSGIVTFYLTPTTRPGLGRVKVELYNNQQLLLTSVSLTTQISLTPTDVVNQIVWKYICATIDAYAVIGVNATTNRAEAPVPTQRKIKILFLTTNPPNTVQLRVDEETRAIDQALRQAEYRIFDTAIHQAMRISDLQELLLRHQPDIVHFSGHGTATNELILQDANGKATLVRGSSLRSLFGIFRDRIRCVVLNACYTDEQAKRLAEVIDCVVGIDGNVTDQAAIQFSTAFYRALGYGRSVQEAFQLGQIQIELDGVDEGSALQLYGAAAAHTCFADNQSSGISEEATNHSVPSTSTASTAGTIPESHNRTDIHTSQGVFHSGSGNIFQITLFQLPFDGIKAWVSDLVRLDQADEHARSSWAGKMLYVLGSAMQRVSSENFLTFLLAALVATLAIWFITPLLDWPQPDAQQRLFAAIRFGVASLILPGLIAFLIKPEGTEKFATGANVDLDALQRKLLFLKLAGAWTGFGALAGTALIVVIVCYHLFGSTMPTLGLWFLALLPPFFAYVSARRIPIDRYKMFKGELRLHDADPLFLAVFALFGPILAAVIYWGHEFLINRAAILSVLLGIIGLTVWEIRQRDENRFPDFILIGILGVLLPLGFLLLFFFDMGPWALSPAFMTDRIDLIVIFSIYVLSTTLLLATVAVRQLTVLTVGGLFSLLVTLLVLSAITAVNLRIGCVVVIGTLLLWYFWGRRQFRVQRWLLFHPSVDWLFAALIGAALLGYYTKLALWGNALLFGLAASVLVIWAYRSKVDTTKDQAEQGIMKLSAVTRWGVFVFLGIAAVVSIFVIQNYVPIIPTQPTPTAGATQVPLATDTVIPTLLPTASPTETPSATATIQRLTVARPAPGQNRYFIEGPNLEHYALDKLLAVYARDAGGNEFDFAVVWVVDKNVGNLVVQVIFQHENYEFDSLAALQLDDQLENVDLASMKPANPSYVGFMLTDATVRLVSGVSVKVDDQLEAVQLTRSGDTLPFPQGPLLLQIDSIGTGGKVAAVSSATALPSLGTLLILPTNSQPNTPSPTQVITPTETATPTLQLLADLPIYESLDGIVKLTWENARGEWGVNNQRLQVRRFENGLAAVFIASPDWSRYTVQLDFGTLKQLDDSGNVNVPFSNFHVLIHFQGDANGYWFTVANNGTACTINRDGVSTQLGPSLNQWGEMFNLLLRQYSGDHTLKISVRGNQYAFVLDDQAICSFQDDTYSQGKLGVAVSEGASGRMWIDNVRIEPLD